jgi:hypothetical protein
MNGNDLCVAPVAIDKFDAFKFQGTPAAAQVVVSTLTAGPHILRQQKQVDAKQSVVQYTSPAKQPTSPPSEQPPVALAVPVTPPQAHTYTGVNTSREIDLELIFNETVEEVPVEPVAQAKLNMFEAFRFQCSQ